MKREEENKRCFFPVMFRALTLAPNLLSSFPRRSAHFITRGQFVMSQLWQQQQGEHRYNREHGTTGERGRLKRNTIFKAETIKKYHVKFIRCSVSWRSFEGIYGSYNVGLLKLIEIFCCFKNYDWEKESISFCWNQPCESNEWAYNSSYLWQAISNSKSIYFEDLQEKLEMFVH